MMLLQVPVIPEGPAWAVAIVLILGGLVALGHVAVKLVKVARNGNGNGNGSRYGTRRNDDNKVTRQEITEEIKGELNLLSLSVETHETVVQLADEMHDLTAVLARITETLAASQKLLDVVTSNQVKMEIALSQIGERLQHMPTTAETLADGSLTRHDIRGMLHELVWTGKIKPATAPT